MTGDAMHPLEDALGRPLKYLRLSITDRCNFRCSYCLPDGCPPQSGPGPLSVDEIRRLARGFAALGVQKVRITGGEPTLRRDVVDVVAALAATPGIRDVGLSTNGYRLERLVPELRAAGLTALNVSVDSLDPTRFERITGSRRLAAILAGVEAAIDAGLRPVKVNAVLLRGTAAAELEAFLEWTRGRPVTVRFIELMRTGDNGAFFEEHHVSASTIASELQRRGWALRPRAPTDGPAITFGHPDHAGRVGLIAPYSASFCERCNRVRASAQGALRLCLFGGDDVPLRAHLASDASHDALVAAIAAAVKAKPPSHLLHEGAFGSMANLAAIGG